MIAAIVPQFFSTDIAKTLAFYNEKLGFAPQFEYGKPVYFAGVIRDGLSIFIRHVDMPPPLPGRKYEDELLDAYIRVDGIDKLFAEYMQNGVDMHRPLARMAWGFAEFVVRDPEGRLLCFGEATEESAP